MLKERTVHETIFSPEVLPVVKNFFALEGFDGVGKSTAIEGLKNRGYTTYKTPPEEIAWQRKSFDNAPLIDRLNYYLKGVEMVGQKAAATSNGIPQFSDRFILTTVAAHQAMGIAHEDVGGAVLNYPDMVLPEATILLTASDDVRMQRLLDRGANDNDLNNLKINDHIFHGFRQWAAEWNHPVIELDISTLTPEQVVDNIINLTR